MAHEYDYRADRYGSIIPPEDGKSGPLYRSVAFGFQSTEEGRSIFDGTKKGFAYNRIGNPTVRRFEEAMCAGEARGLKGYDALATNSGMSAIALVMFHLAAHEEKRLNVVSSPAVYGGTFDLFSHYAKNVGIEVRMVAEMDDIDAWDRLIDDSTAFLFIETPANPQLKVFNIRAFADLAHSRNTLLVVDNTICTFVQQRPLACGADAVVISTTKSINGHCNALGGVVVARDEIINGKPKDSTGKMGMRFSWAIDLGTTMSPEAADLTLYGMRDLTQRVKRASENARALADFFKLRSEVRRVYFPFDLLQGQMEGPGCLLGIELDKDVENTRVFIDTIAQTSKHIFHGPHLGGHMTMVAHPASTTHARVDSDMMARLGISPTFVRISAGIENAEQLKKVLDDFSYALKVV